MEIKAPTPNGFFQFLLNLLLGWRDKKCTKINNVYKISLDVEQSFTLDVVNVSMYSHGKLHSDFQLYVEHSLKFYIIAYMWLYWN